jgi:hypothetical protein
MSIARPKCMNVLALNTIRYETLLEHILLQCLKQPTLRTTLCRCFCLYTQRVFVFCVAVRVHLLLLHTHPRVPLLVLDLPKTRVARVHAFRSTACMPVDSRLLCNTCANTTKQHTFSLLQRLRSTSSVGIKFSTLVWQPSTAINIKTSSAAVMATALLTIAHLHCSWCTIAMQQWSTCSSWTDGTIGRCFNLHARCTVACTTHKARTTF